MEEINVSSLNLKIAENFLSLKELVELIKLEKIHTVSVFIVAHDYLFLKSFSAAYFLIEILENGFRFSDTRHTYNGNDSTVTNKYLSRDNLYDIPIMIEKDSFRYHSWIGQGNDYVFCFGKVIDYDKINLNPFNPRNVLKNVIEKFCDSENLKFNCGTELEYYILKNKCNSIIENYPKINLKESAMNFKKSEILNATSQIRYEHLNGSLRKFLKNASVPIESIISESGPGQQEIIINYGEPILTLDNLTITKQCIKEVAEKSNIGVSYMAKTFIERYGSAIHFHTSALNKDTGKNIFIPTQDDVYEIKNKDEVVLTCSKNLIYFIGGICKYSRELYLCYAPYINSYKRLISGNYAPIYINTWCYDNKFTPIRILGSDENLRVEVRYSGSDVNPYVSLSAILASGMKGIKEKIMPPGDNIIGNIDLNVEDYFIPAPETIKEAIVDFENSEFAHEIFGKYYEIILNNAKREYEDFQNHISNYEINRYIDIC